MMPALDRKTVEDLVFDVQKPGRYVGGEFNAIEKKDPLVRMGICYPDLYEIGMSNNGIRILYDRANRVDGVSCERFFPVDLDFEKKLRGTDVPLYTLESYVPLHELDLIGFNVSHELLYTNVLQCLDLGKVPLTRFERKHGDPIVMGGGGGLSNPMPGMDFFDLIFIGDGEDGICEILSAIAASKKRGSRREEIIRELSKIDGVLDPSLYDVSYRGKSIESITGPLVKKRICRSPFSGEQSRPVVPNIRIAQERVVLEVARGCKNFCKYCHAGYYDLPYRFCDYHNIKEDLDRLIAATGYNEVTLSSLSISDYRDLVQLINHALPDLTRRGISISLPSLRVDTGTIPVAQELSEVRKTSLTFAVESASKALRERAGKRVVDEEILELSKYFLNRGWRVIKFYFMIGLPGCEDEDEAASIIAMLKKITSVTGKRCEINVTVSPFVPKPHTPFQRRRQMGPEYLRETVMKIKKGLPRNIRVKNHDINATILEGVIARGDTRLGKVILNSYSMGCRYDSWTEHFKYDIWARNLDDYIPWWRELLDSRGVDEILPWQIMATGFEKIIEKKQADAPLPESGKGTSAQAPALDREAFENARKDFARTYDVRETVRFRFEKKGTARFVSHIDFIEIIKRCMRMSELPLSYSQGFNKREKISAGFPVPLGIESESELCDVDLYETIDADCLDRLNANLPPGIRALGCTRVTGKQSLMALTALTEYEIKGQDDLMAGIKNFMQEKRLLYKGKNEKKKEIPVGDAVHSWKEGDAGSMLLLLVTGTEHAVRVDEIIVQACNSDYSGFNKFQVTKKGQYSLINGNITLID